MQIAVGIGLILNGRYNIMEERQVWKANKVNNFTLIGIFTITVINVFVSAFGVASSTTVVQPLRIVDEVENSTLQTEML